MEQGLARCPCGAPHSCISKVLGRLQDQFIFADGRQIHPQVFATPIYRLIPHLRRYQIVQEAMDRIVVKLQLSPMSPPMGKAIETMTGRMARDLGDAIRLRVEVVDDIPCEPNGKFRTFRCLVARD